MVEKFVLFLILFEFFEQFQYLFITLIQPAIQLINLSSLCLNISFHLFVTFQNISVEILKGDVLTFLKQIFFLHLNKFLITGSFLFLIMHFHSFYLSLMFLLKSLAFAANTNNTFLIDVRDIDIILELNCWF